MMARATVPQVNGVVLVLPQESVGADELRQRACSELLRQAAIRTGLLSLDNAEPQGGVMTEQASQAIEVLLQRELQLPEPSDEACRRYHTAHASRYTLGERILARHVLFAVMPGVDVAALRERAVACLLDLRCQTLGETDRFAQTAVDISNCPSGAQGGGLGWLTAADCAPEFARELFGRSEVGVLPRLVHSRFGLHVVEVLAREPGTAPSFEAVLPAVAQALRQQTFATALRQYLQLLASQAQIDGVDLSPAASPLVQ